CLRGLCKSNSDGLLLAQICHRQLSLLPGEMLICAGRKALIVAVEMVNYYGVFEKELDRARTTDETNHGNHATGDPFIRAAIRPLFLHTVFPPITRQTRHRHYFRVAPAYREVTEKE